jgi:hypothetical protein
LDKSPQGGETEAMTDDMKAGRNSIPKLRPKRQPQVIDAEAKDVTPPPAGNAEREPRAKAEAKTEPGPQQRAESETQAAPAPAAKADLAAALPAILVAAVTGVGAGLLGSWFFSSAPVPPADTSSVNNAIAQLSSRLSQQETKPQQPSVDLAPLNERSAKLETATGALRGEIAEVKKLIEAQAKAPATATAADVAAVNRRLAQIEERVGVLAALAKPEPKPEPKPDTSSAEVVALGALRDAVATGAAFQNELNSVRGLSKERAAALAPLQSFAAGGLPTVAALAKQFEAVASKMLNPPPPPDSGVLTRLWSNAGKLVDVRPVGEPQGSDTGAVVARMEAKLARGDLAGALDESKALAAAVRDSGKDWFVAAERRRDAEALIKREISAALAAIAAERPKP